MEGGGLHFFWPPAEGPGFFWPLAGGPGLFDAEKYTPPPPAFFLTFPKHPENGQNRHKLGGKQFRRDLRGLN